MKTLLFALKDRVGIGTARGEDIASHLAAAAGWLARAQDSTGSGGVAAWYDLKKAEWKAAYPETTGYIVPTLYDYAKFAGRPEFRERARKMAEWETDIQLEDGGVRAGTVDSEIVAPTIFNTGQVLFGWARAWRETRDTQFKDALIRASDWLVAAQDEDGAWRRFASPFAAHKINSYNTRTAFGLARAGQILADERYVEAAKANVAWVLGRAHANGWLEDNCLNDNERPLTHTIAYSIRGILEVGEIADVPEYLDAAVQMAEAVAASQRVDGALPARLDRDWAPAVRWSCVTGNAQMAINWLRLASVTGKQSFVAHAQRANRFNLRVHDTAANDPGVRGGVKGSHPIDGGYMTYRYPNWAAKFFMDALMLEQNWTAGAPGSPGSESVRHEWPERDDP